jgi:hypothetical protein
MDGKKFEFRAASGGVLRATEVDENICLDLELPEMKLTCFVRLSKEEARNLGGLLQSI